MKGAQRKVFASTGRAAHWCALIFALVIIPGCSPLKGYAGPELSDGETALIRPDGDADLIVEGKTIRHRAMRLLPGEYRFRALHRFNEGDRRCTEHNEHDFVEYERCLAEQASEPRPVQATEPCVPDRFVRRVLTCTVPTFEIQCSLEATVRAGAEYQFLFVRTERSAQAWLVEQGPAGRAVTAACGARRERSSRTERFAE